MRQRGVPKRNQGDDQPGEQALHQAQKRSTRQPRRRYCTAPRYPSLTARRQPPRAQVLQLKDGLAIPQVGANAFEIAHELVDLAVTVTEEQIAIAILRLVESEKSVVEGAAATPLAACLSGKLKELAGKRVVLLLCGGNIDPNVLSRVIERGLVADGRLCRFTAVISDRPGGLADLASQIASTGASIKQVAHDRAFATSDVSTVNVLCTVETRNHQHLAELRAQLKSHGVETYDSK